MATPEQNMLLAMQLFQPTAGAIGQISDNRLNVALKMATMDREERLRRAAAEDSYRRAVDVENLRLKHDDARIASAEKRAQAAAEAAEKRAGTAAKLKDAADIENEFDKLYPQYAQAAARAGIPVKQREDYPATRAGLGQLAADFRTAEVGFVTKREGLAAEALLSGLDDKQAQLQEAKGALKALSEPSPEDQKFARGRAVEAVAQAIESNALEGADRLKADAKKKGIAALRNGDNALARKLLGESAMAAYETAFEQTLMALPNTRSRLQLRAQAQSSLLALQRDSQQLESDLRKAAGTNPALAEGLTKKRAERSGIMSLMTEEPQANKTRSLDEIFGRAAKSETPAAIAPANRMQAPLVELLGGDDPIIARENQRRQDAAATGIRSEYQGRADEWNADMDQLTALQTMTSGVRGGDPAAVARATNPMGGYIPGQLDPSLQATALSRLLQQATEQQKQADASRLRMLYLPDQPIIGRSQ